MIRKADTADIPLIREMAWKVFPQTYSEILSKEQSDYMMDMMYSEESLLSQMTQRGHMFLVDDGRGYASFRYEGRNDDGRDVFHLEKLYVLPSEQGKGLGTELFQSAVSEIRKASIGSPVLRLNVNRYNKAVSFYEHLGMHMESSGDFPIGEGYYMNDYIMAMDL